MIGCSELVMPVGGLFAKKMRVGVPWLMCGLVFAVALAQSASADERERVERVPPPAREGAVPTSAAYDGWLKYLGFEVQQARARFGTNSAEARAAMERLAQWSERAASDPQVLSKLRGVQEWAYVSPVDGSGQPFKLMIPTDYDPARPAPLSLYMHGYGGNHLEHSTGMRDHTGSFEVAVLGRARGGNYVGLSEADVLAVLDYVQAHWSIDPDRITLNGGSMGGWGTFRLCARYPDRFASGAPTCGYASELPVGNLLTTPIYAIHSDDDRVVPIMHSRGPLAWLRERGGQAVFDETTGYGHASWSFEEGQARARAWTARQVRRAGRDVRHVDYTALDGVATRAWWAEVVEWGPENRPARFVVSASPETDALYVQLTNVARLKILPGAAPFDRARSLAISVNGGLPVEVSAPLPESISLVATDDGRWSVVDEGAEIPATRFHTPGGPLQLYDGTPLLIVYGTTGDVATQAALRAAASAAARSPNPRWAGEGGEAGAEGTPHEHNLYGGLVMKADVDVTAEDLACCHLVLIGSVEQNSVVARMTGALPVRLSADQIVCDDGVRIPAAHRSFGLVCPNPFAPQRLVYWVASNEVAAYRAGSPVVELMGTMSIGADFAVAEVDGPTVVAARSFDSRWRWSRAGAGSELLDASLVTPEAFGIAVAESVRRAAGADFAVAGFGLDGEEGRRLGAGTTDAHRAPVFAAGETRVADITPFMYFAPVAVMDLSGSEILELAARLDASAGDEGHIHLYPTFDSTGIERERTYRLASSVSLVWSLGRLGHIAPRSYRLTEIQVADAVSRFLGRR